MDSKTWLPKKSRGNPLNSCRGEPTLRMMLASLLHKKGICSLRKDRTCRCFMYSGKEWSLTWHWPRAPVFQTRLDASAGVRHRWCPSHSWISSLCFREPVLRTVTYCSSNTWDTGVVWNIFFCYWWKMGLFFDYLQIAIILHSIKITVDRCILGLGIARGTTIRYYHDT